MNPKTKRRWMKNALEQSRRDAVAMPWHRGAPRAAMLARRVAETSAPAKRPAMAAC